MATSEEQKFDENVMEVKKMEDSQEDSHNISLSQTQNNIVVHDDINETTKQIDYTDINDITNVNERNRVEKNLFDKKSNDEMVDKVKNNIDYEENKNENSRVLIDQSKNNNYQAKTETIVGKRKYKSSSDINKEKTLSSDGSESITRKRHKGTNDCYCWRCHKDIVEANCSACVRSWHRKCMGGTPPTSTTDYWICGECASILQAENATTRSPTMAHLTVDQLCMVLKYVIDRMRSFPGAEPFWTAVNLEEVPNYLDYVVKPMDLNLLESNVNSKLYGSTDAFMADVKWIQHNCIVFNTCGGEYADTSKLTNAAKQIVKIARQEVSEIEACPDCYARGRNLPRAHPSWFIEACRQPHPLVWAKLKGFPFWPAKALPRINGQGHVDVRFFGEHDRAWVSPKDIYLYSRDPPTSLPRKKKQDMFECMLEITQHCQKLEMTFGPFQFAPPRIQYNPHDPMQIKYIFPEYNPDRLYDTVKEPYRDVKLQSPSKKQSLPLINTCTPTKNDVSVNDNLDVKEFDNLMEDGNNSSELQNNDRDQSKKVDERLKQKNRFKKLPSTIRCQNNKKKLSEKSIVNETVVKKNNKVTPKIQKVRSTLSKKFVEPAIDGKIQKVSPKNRQNYIRKVNMTTSTPLLNPSVNGKITTPNIIRIYKPKASIVDKLNAENEIRNKSPKKLTNSQTQDNQFVTEDTKSVVNVSNSQCPDGSADESLSKHSDSSVDSPNQKIIISRSQDETKESVDPQQTTPVVIKYGKAKKSFPNKPPRAPIRIPIKAAIDSIDSKACFQINSTDNDLNYQLPPPEVGPLCAQLNRGANELASKMARLIEETIQEAAQSNLHGNSIDAHEATVYSLRLQIERMRWKHQQQLAELKYNADQTLREMRASLEMEQSRAIEEIRKEAEEERIKCVNETKSKQWCSFCGREALYYCCWNTAYCDHSCQQKHWQTHRNQCCQNSTAVDNSTASDNQESSSAHQSQQDDQTQQQQAMPRLITNAPHSSSNVRGA